MCIISALDYLNPVREELKKLWPENRTVNIICHGHSVPAGYFIAPAVHTFDAYPHLLHKKINAKYPNAVVNVIVTAIGGETSLSGAARFENDVLCHKPDVITIDYGLNDRRLQLEAAEKSWRAMIEKALERGVKIILLTPSWDISYNDKDENWRKLEENAEQIRKLAESYQIGLSDSFAAFDRFVQSGGQLSALLSYDNHPGRQGHGLIARELAKWF